MPFVVANKLCMYYNTRGTGPEPVLFISGLGADHRVWDALVPEFAGKYRCLQFDNRGVGKTDKPRGRYSTELLAQDASALLTAIDIPRAHVIGISMGGAIAQELAIHHPEKVGSLILISTWAKADTFRRELGECRLRAAKAGNRDAFWREHLLWCFTHDFYEEHRATVNAARTFLAKTVQPAYALARQTEAVINHDALNRLHRIQAPTLVVVGDEDISTPVRFSRVIHEKIKGAKLTVLKGAAHSLTTEKPRLFVDTALKFLARHPIRSKEGIAR
jgi:pimeloyl-ACP methyl ester carboxylesterase